MSKDILDEILMDSDVVGSLYKNMDTLIELIPEVKNMMGFEHKHPHHHLDVWNHTLCALCRAPMDFTIRMAILLHDIGKPHSYQEGEIRHFKHHPMVSGLMTVKILSRLGFSQEEVQEISDLVVLHDDLMTDEFIKANYAMAQKLFQIQYCDALAHHPQKLERRIKYLLRTNEKVNDGTLKEAFNKELNLILNKKTR